MNNYDAGQVFDAGPKGWNTCADCGLSYSEGYNKCPKCVYIEAHGGIERVMEYARYKLNRLVNGYSARSQVFDTGGQYCRNCTNYEEVTHTSVPDLGSTTRGII